MVKCLSLPEDVKRFLEELKRRGIKPEIVAIERTPPPDETYHVFKDQKYEGVRSADDVFREKNFVVCGKLTCAAFVDEVIKLVLDRLKDRIATPEET